MGNPFTAAMIGGGNVSSQPDYRRNYNARDDWGRSWLLCVDIKSGGLAGPAVPAGWEDPLAIPPIYIKLDPMNPNRVIVEYERWARDMEVATRGWEEKLHAEGEELFGTKYDANEPPDIRLLKRVGTRPMSPDIIRAAAMGDPRFLGVRADSPLPAGRKPGVAHGTPVLTAGPTKAPRPLPGRRHSQMPVSLLLLRIRDHPPL